MFDNKFVPNQSATATGVIPPKNSKINSALNGTQPTPASFRPKEADKEPEDIFNNSDPINSTTNQPSSAPVAAVSSSPLTTSAVTDAEREPAINNAHSVFKKLATTLPTNSTAADNDSVPPMPPIPVAAPTNKKNIIIFIILIIVFLGLAAGAYWFFILRDKPATILPTQQVDLFESQPFNANSAGRSKNDNTPVVNNSQPQNKDTDGDGLSDEAELLLGTSINSVDTDNDGLSDKDEVKVYRTDPLNPDTDNDGVSDGTEVKNKTNPLEAVAVTDPAGYYTNDKYKLAFTLLNDMVFESEANGILRFNDNVYQIKLYIYTANTQPKDLTPDINYTISEDSTGKLVIKGFTQNEDTTPYSTNLSTNAYHSQNGLTYLIRYVATRRADNHLSNFEQILQSFNFKK